jgi:outer membrane protein assembly complex protein YaeT
MFSALSAEINPEPYENKPILSIDIEAPLYEDISELKDVIGIERGYLFSLNDLQAAQKRLYALGRFTDVRVYASRQQQSVELIFYLRGIKRLQKLEFQGLSTTKKSKLREYLAIRPGIELGEKFENKLVKNIKTWLSNHGFLESAVSLETIENPAQAENTIIANIFQGEQTKINKIVFQGEFHVFPELLMNTIRTKENRPFNVDELEKDRIRLEKIFLERGFLRVKVFPPETQIKNEQASVRFKVNAGPRIQVIIDGNTVLTKKEILFLWPLKDEPLGPGTIELFASKLKQHYHFLGFPDATIKTELTKSKSGLSETILYSIKEGPHPYVENLEIDGLSFFEPSFIKNQIKDELSLRLEDYLISQRKFSRELSSAWLSSKQITAKEHHSSNQEFSVANRWVPRLYKQALDSIIAIYHEHGYLEAKHKACKLELNKSGFYTARCKLILGEQIELKTIRFKGPKIDSPESHFELVKNVFETGLMGLQKPVGGKWFLSYAKVEKGRIKLVRDYRNKGYLYVQIDKDIQFDPDNTAHLTYILTPGPQVHIGRTLVKGNVYTNESIIRSRLSIKPGDVYSLQQAINAQRSISDLGVFRRVRVKLIDEEIPSEQKDLVAEVIERDRQPIELSPGISTADGPRLRLSYSHINVLGTASTFTGTAKLNRQMFFSLFGDYAESLEDRYRSYDPSEQFLKAVERELRFGIRSPKLINLALSPLFRFDVIHERENTIPYSLDTAAAIFGIEMTPIKHLSFALEPQLSLTNLECETLLQSEETSDCTSDIFQENNERRRIDKGLRQSAKIGPTLTYDGRNDPINPHRGIWLHASAQSVNGQSQENSAATFEPFSYTKIESNFTAYLPLWRATFAFSARGGTILNTENSAVPIDERFYLGGRDTLRGYIEGTMIPEDACLISDGGVSAEPNQCAETLIVEQGGTPISRGGNTFALLKSELRLPFSESFSIGLFVDMGNLWVNQPNTKNLRWRFGTGAGIRYKTPVGALALDWGLNPNPREDYNEQQSNIHFSVGLF